MSTSDIAKPKLIEVALPLAAINAAAAREKSIRHGHPSTLHLWWARRPLAATRAVIWASLVDDPSGDESLTPEQQDAERQRLFGILEQLVVWENSNNPRVLAAAKAEIDRCYPDGPPPILDPFGGGGAIPLEAQRLGLQALSGDLNPVAVLIQRAMIEIPSRFAGRPPINPALDAHMTTWERAQGLAADIEAYGRWMRDEARKRIGQHYPDVDGPNGEKLTPIAWIWARTVQSPDPAWNGHVPLVASWVLSRRPGKPLVWIEPIINRENQTITYEIREGGEPTSDRTITRGKGTCLATGVAIPDDYIRQQSSDGLLGEQLLAVVAASGKGRSFFSLPRPYPGGWPAEWEGTTQTSLGELPKKGLGFRVQRFGMTRWEQLFSQRQLLALTTFSDLLSPVHEQVQKDAVAAGLPDDGQPLRSSGTGALAYADAVVTYLAFTIDKCADYWSTICSWHNSRELIRNTFGLPAIPMTWDYAEANPFSSSSGNWLAMVDWVRKAVDHLPAGQSGGTRQRDARARVTEQPGAVISTDPPYYDNIGYADLSDFFFVWLRRNLLTVWPDECATLTTPKVDELIADPHRHGGRKQAAAHFESGMAEFAAALAKSQSRSAPATIYYAYQATESRDGTSRSTGWDTFLQAVISAGIQITATWPIRTELANRRRGIASNALASSIVLSCRARTPAGAALASTGEFLTALRAELPDAVRLLQSGNIAPVDMAQSTIGPGIKIFSRYAKVVEADGTPMSVSDALLHVNTVLSEILDGESADLDRDTRFAVAWFELHGYNPGPAGDADSQTRSKGTTVAGVVDAGIAESGQGKVRLKERTELSDSWSPTGDDRLTVWETTQYLIAALDRSESEAAHLLGQLGGVGDQARSLAYMLFKKATDKGWADEAAAYNRLITAWPNLADAASHAQDGQQTLM